ncbi:MAG: hypothetical protein RH945_12965 [Hyphomonas sp.]|tara:strand:- start:814 stop:984 length:171 start_codon:yes stop_codon:yes gene_type:complete
MKTLIETTPVAEMTISNVTPAAQARHLPEKSRTECSQRPYILARRSARWARRVAYT